MGTLERIFELVDKKYNEQRHFAADIGVTPSIVSEWRRGKSASYNKYLPKIASTLGTTAEYLLTGKKAARPQEGDELLHAVEELSEENRQKAREYIEMLLKLQDTP